MGHNAREVMHDFDYALGYELMRCVLRTQLKSLPPMTLARVLGVRWKRIRFFLDGGDPGPALWDAASAMAEGMEEPGEVEMEAVALNLLADLFPRMERPRVRAALAAALMPVLEAERERCGKIRDC
jgi:hypothetical protein